MTQEHLEYLQKRRAAYRKGQLWRKGGVGRPSRLSTRAEQIASVSDMVLSDEERAELAAFD